VPAEACNSGLLLFSFGSPFIVILVECQFRIEPDSQPAHSLSVVSDVMVADPNPHVNVCLMFLAFGEQNGLSLVLFKVYCILLCPGQCLNGIFIELLGSLLHSGSFNDPRNIINK
jgi:hypothetical protein